jgi:hypothetical protein
MEGHLEHTSNCAVFGIPALFGEGNATSKEFLSRLLLMSLIMENLGK